MLFLFKSAFKLTIFENNHSIMKFHIFFLLIVLSANAQRDYKTVLLPDGQKEFWNVAKPDIKKSSYNYNIRYEVYNQIVNLYSNDSINFQGTVLSYLIEQKTSGERSVDYQYVYDITELPSEDCSKIGRKIFSEKFYNLPTDDSIKGYLGNWLDCGYITYTYKINNRILNKNYSCPWQQPDSITEVKILKQNYRLIDSLLNLSEISSKFSAKLEKGKSYSNGFNYIYMMTVKESAAWKKYKPLSDYLKSVKDTTDTLLKNHILENYDREIKGYDFQLDFSKKGKLQKIGTTLTFRERLYDKEYRKYRKMVKLIFRKFNLKSLHLKYSFSREIHFDSYGKASIYDPTIYHN